MSFILDALKRSEQERASSSHNPAIAVDVTDTTQAHRRHFPWILILLFLTLIAAATALFLFKNNPPVTLVENQIQPAEENVNITHNQSNKTPDNSEIISTKPETQKLATDVIIAPPPLASQARMPEIKPPRPLAQHVQKKVTPKKSTKTKDHIQSRPDPKSKPAQVTPPSAEKPEPTAEPTKDQTPSIQDLPDNDQNMLSAYEINTHFYSDKPGKSFALINMKKYREGDVIENTQHKVEQITSQGVVVYYGAGRVLLSSH